MTLNNWYTISMVLSVPLGLRVSFLVAWAIAEKEHNRPKKAYWWDTPLPLVAGVAVALAWPAAVVAFVAYKVGAWNRISAPPKATRARLQNDRIAALERKAGVPAGSPIDYFDQN